MPATIGHAQKVWTIFAKHLWCHDVIGDPGLCPVDRVMRDITIKELRTHFPNPTSKLLAKKIRGQAWTSMTRSTYFDFLRADLFCASSLGISVSVWELDRFSGGRDRVLNQSIPALKNAFLIRDKWAANPGSSDRDIVTGAFDDMWNSSYLNGSRGLGPAQSLAQRDAVRLFVEGWLETSFMSYPGNPRYGTMPFAVMEVGRLLRELQQNFAWL